MSFQKNVFINCPFDPEYRPMLKALVFTVLYLDLEPLLAHTYSSSAIRINQIKDHIRNSRYSIHDLSRSKPLKKNDLPRFNMPYELGLDIGCEVYGSKRHATKRALILETEKYHYQKVLSDIAGQDIENHNGDPRTLVQKVRNWVSLNSKVKSVPGPVVIWNAYNQFNHDLLAELAPGYLPGDFDEMPVSDYIRFAKDWLRKFGKPA